MANFLFTDGPAPEETESSANQAYATIPPTMGERLGAEAGATTGQIYGFLKRQERFLPSDHYKAPEDSDYLSADEANKQYAPTDADGKQQPIFTDRVLKSSAESIGRAKANEIEREGILGRYGNSASTLTNLGVGAVGFMLDPVQAGTAMLPGIGEEAILAKLGRGMLAETGARAIAGAASGALAMAPVSALKYGVGLTEASDYDLRAAFGDIAGGAMFGAAVHAGVSPALRYGWESARGALAERGLLPATPLEPISVDQLRQNIQADQARNFLGNLQAMEGSQDFLSADPETRRTAMQSVLAQIQDGRPVDVTPIFPDHTEAAKTIDPDAFQEFNDLTKEMQSHDRLIVSRETSGPEEVTSEARRMLPGGVGLEFPEGLTPEEQAQFAIDAYHASPHDFDRFDMSKLGTGEGAQAFGSGLYYAESEATSGVGGAYYRQFLDSHGVAHSYKVSLDVEPHQLLDWDKPLSEQSPEIRSAIDKLAEKYPQPMGETVPPNRYFSIRNWMDLKGGETAGQHLYSTLKENLGGPNQATEALREAGIPGIRYQDQDSRGSEGGTHNIVLFDDKLVKITHKNGEPVTAKERSDALEHMHGGGEEKFALPKAQAAHLKNAAWSFLDDNIEHAADTVDRILGKRVDALGETSTDADFQKVKEAGNLVFQEIRVIARRKGIESVEASGINNLTQKQHLFRAAWDGPVRSIDDLINKGFEGEAPAAERRANSFTGHARGAFDDLIVDYKSIITAYDKGDRDAAVAALNRAIASANELDRLQNSPVARLFTQHARFMAKKFLNDVVAKSDPDASAKKAVSDAVAAQRDFDTALASKDIPAIQDAASSAKSAIGDLTKAREEIRQAAGQKFSLPGFYSPAIRAAEGIRQEKGTGEQFWKQIAKVPGVKKDELDWMGLEEFLKDKKSVTKAEVLGFMRASQAVLDEKVLGGDHSLKVNKSEISVETFRQLSRMDNDEFPGDDVTKIERLSGDGKGAFIVSSGDDDFVIYSSDGEALQQTENYAEAVDIATGILHEGNESATKFGGYKVPGGENYRELLIRLPELGEKTRELTHEENADIAALQNRLDEARSAYRRAHVAGENTHDASEEINFVARQIREIKQSAVTQPSYTSKHFQDQELVHLRVDDRTGPNGEKVLFGNEIQSDLHQQGRQTHYGLSEDERYEKRRQVNKELQETDFQLAHAQAGNNYSSERAVALRRKKSDLIDQLQALAEEGVPNAPFKGDLWLELGLKRMLQYAVENGYDAISWARSDQIAKAVGAEPEKLALQYDQKIGKFLDKYTKKWGGKVEESEGIAPTAQPAKTPAGIEGWTNVDTSTKPDFAEGGKNQILRITPEMRQSVKEGQPFSIGEGNKPVASFRSSDLLIRIAMDADNKLGLFSHEAIHALRHLDVFTPEEWGTLEKTARDQGWIETHRVRERYSELYKTRGHLESLLTEEAIAEQYSQWRTGAKQFTPEIQTLFQKIAAFFERVKQWMTGNGFQTADEATLARIHADHPEQPIFQKIASGEMKERFEAPIRARQAEIKDRLAELEPRIRDAYAQARASRPPTDMAKLADQQRALYRDGFAQGMPQDELKQIMEQIYGSANPSVTEARAATEAGAETATKAAGEATSGEAGAANLKTFKTAKGSSYVVHEDGTTSRDKKYRPEHGEKEQGPQPRSQKTFYVTMDEANELGLFQAEGSKKKIIFMRHEDGSPGAGVQFVDGPYAGKISKASFVKIKEDPAIGLIPVEVWNGGTRVHFGNEIVEVGESRSSDGVKSEADIKKKEGEAEIPPELAAEEARFQQMIDQGYKLDPEEQQEILDSKAGMALADMREQAYNQAAECLMEAGVL